MSCNLIFSRNQRVYLQLEGASSWGTIPNAAGVASVTGTNYCRHISCELQPNRSVAIRQDKTGNRSIPQGVPASETGSWKSKLSLAGNGTPGVVPDCDPYLQALFGKAATITTGVSCAYALSDSVPTLDIWSFRTDSQGTGNPNQQVGVGSILQSANMTFGEDISTIDFAGASKLVLGSYDFAPRLAASDPGTSGLTAWPSEPTSPVSNGTPVLRFGSSLVMDGQSIGTLRTAALKLNTGNKYATNAASPYMGCPIGGVREFMFECELYDADDTGTKDIYQRAYDKNPITVVFQMGNVAGNTWTWTIGGLQLSAYTYDDSSDAYTLKFNDSRATSNVGLTELGLVIS